MANDPELERLNAWFDKNTDYETKLSNRNYDFSTQIDSIVINTEARLMAVMRKSIDSVVEEAQKPTAKGGKMRVVTGFLRHTGIANLNAAPIGPKKGDPKGVYTWTGEALEIVLAKMKFGDLFYFGWSAHYAKYREAHDGFLESALQNWQTHVDKAVAHFRNKDAGK